MAPGDENKDGADTQPKLTEETELQQGLELWNQLVAVDMGGSLSCSCAEHQCCSLGLGWWEPA